MIALILEKGYESVTIRDITERADIGYATFFRHYHAKDDLLQDVLDVVYDEFINLLSPGAQWYLYHTCFRKEHGCVTTPYRRL